jgi:hypothetical protein
MPSEKVKSFVDYEISIKDIPEQWKEWAEKNDAFTGLGSNRSLVLSDIITETGAINRVRVLEKGAKIKYVELTPNTYSLNWDTISVIKAERRPKTALSGINRIYELASGMKYEGQYAGEVPGKTLSVYLDNGVVEVLEASRIVGYSVSKINPKQSLPEQSEFLDILLLKGDSLRFNGESLVKGIIIEQNYKNLKNVDNYLLVQLENGSTQSVKLNEIAEFRKEVNAAYKPLYDVLMQEGEFVINRKETKTAAITENKSGVFLPSDSCSTIIERKHPSTEVVIETRFADEAQSRQLKVVKVNKYTGKRRPVVYGFTFEDIVKKNILPAAIETSVNNITKLQYTISGEGLFVIYDPVNKTAIPFLITTASHR